MLIFSLSQKDLVVTSFLMAFVSEVFSGSCLLFIYLSLDNLVSAAIFCDKYLEQEKNGNSDVFAYYMP